MDCFTIKMKFKICKRLEKKGRQERREEGRGEKGRGRVGGKEAQKKGWEGRREWKKRERNGKTKRKMPEGKEAKQKKERTSKTRTQQKGTISQLQDRFPGGVACPDVTAPCRPRRPRPSVVKSSGTLVAAGRVGRPRSLGGCESPGLWPPAQAAPAAGQGGNCPETRRLSGRVVQGCANRTRGGGSHARLRAAGLSASVLAGTFGERHAEMPCAVPVCRSPQLPRPVKTGSKPRVKAPAANPETHGG